MAILLVRHAETEANVDESLYKTKADFDIALTDNGRKQAASLGLFLDNYLSAHHPGQPVRLWASPYRRTHETAHIAQENTSRVSWEQSQRVGEKIFFDERLREREMGYFDGMSDKEMLEKYPLEYQHMQKNYETRGGKYYSKPYGGEAATDVSLRLNSFYETLWRDMGNGHENHVIVNHGYTLRCFVTSFLRLHPEHFVAMKNPANTAVMLLDKDPETGRFADYGLIYDPMKNNGLDILAKPDKPNIYKTPSLS